MWSPGSCDTVSWRWISMASLTLLLHSSCWWRWWVECRPTWCDACVVCAWRWPTFPIRWVWSWFWVLWVGCPCLCLFPLCRLFHICRVFCVRLLSCCVVECPRVGGACYVTCRMRYVELWCWLLSKCVEDGGMSCLGRVVQGWRGSLVGRCVRGGRAVWYKFESWSYSWDTGWWWWGLRWRDWVPAEDGLDQWVGVLDRWVCWGPTGGWMGGGRTGSEGICRCGSVWCRFGGQEGLGLSW